MRIAALLSLLLLVMLNVQAAEKQRIDTPPFDETVARQMVANSIQRFPLAEDVTIEDAIDSMKLRANQLNFKLVADLPLSEQVKAMGEESRYILSWPSATR